MSEDLATNKLCIDSRFRTESSQSNTDFSIELPESITLPPRSVCMVTDICIPIAWYTIEGGVNDRLYPEPVAPAVLTTNESLALISKVPITLKRLAPPPAVD